MITEQEINNYILKENTVRLENYIIPKIIYNNTNNKSLNILELRNILLSNYKSLHVERFEYDLKQRFSNIYIIKEFPVPIFNKNIWLEKCSKFGINNYKEIECNIFSLDYFFPEQNLVIEIDGDQHQDHRPYDKARDDYIFQVYGLKTLRLESYGLILKEDIKTWNNIITPLLSNQETPNVIDYIPGILSQFKEKFKYELDLIQYFSNNPKEVISISRKAFYKLSKGMIPNQGTRFKIFSKLLLDLIRKSLYLF